MADQTEKTLADFFNQTMLDAQRFGRTEIDRMEKATTEACRLIEAARDVMAKAKSESEAAFGKLAFVPPTMPRDTPTIPLRPRADTTRTAPVDLDDLGRKISS